MKLSSDNAYCVDADYLIRVGSYLSTAFVSAFVSLLRYLSIVNYSGWIVRFLAWLLLVDKKRDQFKKL